MAAATGGAYARMRARRRMRAARLPMRSPFDRGRPRLRRRLLAAVAATAAGCALAAAPAGALPFTTTTVALPGSGVGTESGLGLGDFDGDGRTDVAVGLFSGELSILLRDAAGDYAHAAGSPRTLSTTYLGPLKVADLNRDGRDDVVALRESGGNGVLAVLLGGGDGTLGTVSEVATPGYAVAFALGDLDRDSVLDLAVVSDTLGGPRLDTLLGRGDGTFGAPVESPLTLDDTYPSAVALGDHDRDGALDVAVAHTFIGVGVVSVARGDGAGGFTRVPGSPFDIGSGTLALGTGDLNGDGRLDLAAPVVPASRDNRSLSLGVLLGDGAGGFGAAPAASFTTPPEANPTAAFAMPLGDFDGDGRLDAAIPLSQGGLWPLRGDGTGRFDPFPGGALTAGPTLTAAAAGDLDGDGRADLLATSSSGPARLFLFVNESEPAIAVAPSADLGAAQVGGAAAGAVVTIANPGDHGLRVTGLTVAGAAAGDFAADGCIGAPIPAGGSCDVALAFAPRAAGTRAATLEIASDAPGAPVTTVALSGTGIAPDGAGGGGSDGGGGSGDGSGGGGSGGGGSGGGSGGPGGGSGTTKPAALRLSVRPARLALAPGRRGRVTVTVVNRGGRAATGVTLCPRPRRTIAAGRCLRLGRIAPGRTVRRTVTVTLAKRARRGSRAVLKLTARSGGARTVAARVVVTARR